METLSKQRQLDPEADAQLIIGLKLAAVTQRRRLLELGHDLKVRLHYGASTSLTEMLTVLYEYWMRIDPTHPTWEQRDRFVLSKGHAAPALYIALAHRGYFADSEFDNFRRLHSSLQGHPDRTKTSGVDCTTGSLGQGFAVACGMALGAKIDGARFRTYVIISDGECNEGSTWEAALIAANLKLDNLVVLLDWNKKSSYGEMRGRNDVEPLDDKWRAFGWHVLDCDGHDHVSLTAALAEAGDTKGQPTVIICRTVKGKGIPYAENNRVPSNFGLTEAQYEEAVANLDSLEAAIRAEIHHEHS